MSGLTFQKDVSIRAIGKTKIKFKPVKGITCVSKNYSRANAYLLVTNL